jgi:glutaredoxin 2
MPGIRVETHVLSFGDDQECKVVVWDNGDVDLFIGSEEITVANLADIVAFVETHGQVSLVAESEARRGN